MRAFDGTVSLTQPLIAPLYDGKSEYEFIFALVGSSDTTGYEIVRKYWQGQMKSGDFDTAWRKALYDGFFANTALLRRGVRQGRQHSADQRAKPDAWKSSSAAIR